MLKLRPRRAAKYRCPLHPRNDYAKRVPLCECCQAIFWVRRQAEELDNVERHAFAAIQRAELARSQQWKRAAREAQERRP